MGFLISINGADFKPYQRDVVAPYRYSYVRESTVTNATSALNNNSEKESFAHIVGQTKFKSIEQKIKQHEKSPKRAFRAHQLMTNDPFVLGPDAGFDEANELLTTKRIRHVPIIKDERLVGIVSDRDILPLIDKPKAELKRLKVREIMSDHVVATKANTLVLEVAHLMLEQRISALPVLDPGHKLIGILTTTDLLKGLIRRAPLEIWI